MKIIKLNISRDKAFVGAKEYASYDKEIRSR